VLFIFSAPITIAIGLGLLWREVGVAALPGVALMIIFTLTSGYFGSRIMEIRKRSLAAADLRIRIISEIVQAIKLVKMLGWQQQIVSSVKRARATETSSLVSLAMIKALNITVSFVSSILIIAATFSVYIATDDVLVSAKAFTVLSLFNVLRFPLILFPMALKFSGECFVAFQRIEGFLDQEEAEEDPHITAQSCGDGNALVVRDCVVSWDGSTPTLQGCPVESPYMWIDADADHDQATTVAAAHYDNVQVAFNAPPPSFPPPSIPSGSALRLDLKPVSESPFASHASSTHLSPPNLMGLLNKPSDVRVTPSIELISPPNLLGLLHKTNKTRKVSSSQLHGISLTVPKGMFLSVVGSVGAGYK
jgi:ABC-type multidrug transport system fused ATPase/permease subunit